ncbi:MAG: hypothetical protein CVU48_04970 [Candidatus Cloacimonetes bacterium HGW-Cloacimonetes-1]|jgi:uncharacterized membrane protein|nr:MAG: hypothetical protein CVU48_04970 [Candidatus Cloacimonetes bacterium HGW-Cloacimonetes-1]
MKRLKQFKWALIVLIAHIMIMMFFAVTLPRQTAVPMHWNIAGEIDGWASKYTALSFFLGINIFVFLMLYLTPLYSPWYKKNEERFERILPNLTTILVSFLGLISALSMYIAKTENRELSVNILMLLIGFMFIALGNLMPKVPRNFFIGIRTPWTIANDEVWLRTHRIGGVTFVISGILISLKSFILINSATFQTAVMAAAFVILMYPIAYSFVIYKKLGN